MLRIEATHADTREHRLGNDQSTSRVLIVASDLLSFVPASVEEHFRLIEKRQGLRVPREIIAGFEPSG